MKKIGVLLVITFVIAMIAMSCNKKACPAYSKVETEQVNQVG